MPLVQPHHHHATAQRHVRTDLLAGGLAGQVAGLVMALAMMAAFTLFLGRGPLFPVQVIGSIVTGDVAVQGFHLPSLLLGLALHQLGPSLFWGLVFAEVVHALDLRRIGWLWLVGLGVGVVSQLIDVHLVLPLLFDAVHGHDLWAENVPVLWSLVAHVVFGLALASYGWLRPRLGAS